VARLFAESDEVANVLIGPDFVAVGLRRPADWETFLQPLLAAVTEEFASSERGPDTPRVMGGPAGAGATRAALAVGPEAAGTGHPRTRLEEAWRQLGSLRPADAPDLARVLAAATGDDAPRRQVAASLLREADPREAATRWMRLATDPVRSVRRAAVDSVVDVGRQELRPLLETALADTDPWVRWKALRGLVELGPGPSRAAITALSDDPDFRVRLEAASALRSCASWSSPFTAGT